MINGTGKDRAAEMLALYNDAKATADKFAKLFNDFQQRAFSFEFDNSHSVLLHPGTQAHTKGLDCLQQIAQIYIYQYLTASEVLARMGYTVSEKSDGGRELVEIEKLGAPAISNTVKDYLGG